MENCSLKDAKAIARSISKEIAQEFHNFGEVGKGIAKIIPVVMEECASLQGFIDDLGFDEGVAESLKVAFYSAACDQISTLANLFDFEMDSSCLVNDANKAAQVQRWQNALQVFEEMWDGEKMPKNIKNLFDKACKFIQPIDVEQSALPEPRV